MISIGLIGPLIGLILIFVAAAVSHWFSFWDNALSDLGRMDRSSAPLFNLGLGVSGYTLSSVIAVKHLRRVARIILFVTGLFLVLVGVYNESYGALHFVVSVLFFIGLMTYLFYTGIIDKSYSRILVATSHIIVWTIHFALHYPPGIALPELYAVLSFLYFYVMDVLSIQKNIIL